MDFSEEIKNVIKERYLRVKALLKTNDPEDDPFKSDNEAKQILFEMIHLLKENVSNENELDTRENAMIAGIHYLLGTVYLSLEEFNKAEEQLLQCYYELEDISCHPDNVLIAASCLNQLGLLYARTDRNDDALIYLDKGDNIYTKYTINKYYVEPLMFCRMYADMSPNEDKNGKVILESTHSLTLDYLAQVHTALGNVKNCLLYGHESLKRQLEMNRYDQLEWIVKAASLAHLFMDGKAFKQSRHFLAAASYVLDDYENRLINEESSLSSKELEEKKKEVVIRKNEILRSWIKYSLLLFSFSEEVLKKDYKFHLGPHPKELLQLCFPSLSESLNENIVTCDPICNYEDALKLFLFGQRCCNEAKQYYTSHDYRNEYIVITMDHCELYLELNMFQEDENKKCKILKRRFDLLCDLLKIVNPNDNIDICREIWTTLGQVCVEMVQFKVSKVKQNDTADMTVQQVLKVNSLIEYGVNCFINFIKSFIDKSTNRLPVNYPADQEESFILSNLQAARLYSNFISPGKQKSAEIQKKSAEFYKAVVDYARTHEHIARTMGNEVQLANDMLTIIPLKIKKLLT